METSLIAFLIHQYSLIEHLEPNLKFRNEQLQMESNMEGGGKCYC